MDPGKLNKRIIIQKYDRKREEWRNYFVCWAAINGLFGSEYYAARAQQAENTVNFSVRYSKRLECLTPQDYRVIFRRRIYDIEHIDNPQFADNFLTIKAVNKIGRSTY